MKGTFGKAKLVTMIVLVLVLSVMGAGAAGGPPGGGFYSGQTIQNLGTQAGVSVTLYDKDNAATTYTKDWTIPEGGALPSSSVTSLGCRLASSARP